MNKRCVKLAIVASLTLIFGLAWAWLNGRQSSEMTELKQSQEYLFSEETRNSMSDEEWTNAVAELKHKASSLSAEGQTRLWKNYYEQTAKEKNAYLDRFFALKTKRERDAYVDTIIESKQAGEKKAGWKGKNAGKRAAKKGAAKKSGFRTAEKKRDGLRKFLDKTTADERARSTAFKDAVEARRKERGL